VFQFDIETSHVISYLRLVSQDVFIDVNINFSRKQMKKRHIANLGCFHFSSPELLPMQSTEEVDHSL